MSRILAVYSRNAEFKLVQVSSRYGRNWFQVVFNYIMSGNFEFGILLILVKLWNSLQLSITAVYG